MKSAFLLALAVGSTAAAPAHKALRKHHHHHHHAKPVGAGLRFAKAKAAEVPVGPGVSDTIACDPAIPVGTPSVPFMTAATAGPATSASYRLKCSEGANGAIKSGLGCVKDDAWTILKGGFTVSCQWVKKDGEKWIGAKPNAPSGECKGLGEKKDSCERKYQTVAKEVVVEVLKGMPDGYFDLEKMPVSLKGFEDPWTPKVMHGPKSSDGSELIAIDDRLWKKPEGAATA